MLVLFYHILIEALLHLMDNRRELLLRKDRLNCDLEMLLVFCRFPEKHGIVSGQLVRRDFTTAGRKSVDLPGWGGMETPSAYHQQL